MKMRKIKMQFLSALVIGLAACANLANGAAIPSAESGESAAGQDITAEAGSSEAVVEISTDAVYFETSTEYLVDYSSGDADAVIQLEGNSVSIEGEGVSASGTLISVTSEGNYWFSGSLQDGQIVVDTEDEDPVVLILNGVDIQSQTSAPIYIKNAERTIISLTADSENVVSDNNTYQFTDPENEEPNAAIFSNDDLTISGTGSLSVIANFNNGITSQDDLKIISGTITINTANDGLKGRDSIVVEDGTITINAGGDGLQSNNDEDPEEGIIAVEGGVILITAELDGMQAENSLTISGGEIDITTGGGSGNSSTSGGGMWGGGRGQEGNPNKTDESAKGLKAGSDLIITAGQININSADDAVHSNGTLTINGGSLVMSSGDDGIHADTSLEINGGEITLSQSYEGLESALITINDGNIYLVASDDGINVAGGADGSSLNGRPGQNQFAVDSGYHLYIHGGYIYMNAGGDGLDSNGAFDMTGGVVIVNGPTNNGNGPLDYMGSFNISGGFLVAVGSAGMAQAPSQTSTQYSLLHIYSSVQNGGTVIHLESADGEEILTFRPEKEYQSLLISSPEMDGGGTYLLYSGGSSTGSESDGLYSSGTYSGGTQLSSYTLTQVVTGSGGGMMGGPGGGRVPGGKDGRPGS